MKRLFFSIHSRVLLVVRSVIRGNKVIAWTPKEIDQATEAWWEGFNAYHSDVYVCPYPDGPAADDWDDGWWYAAKHWLHKWKAANSNKE